MAALIFVENVFPVPLSETSRNKVAQTSLSYTLKFSVTLCLLNKTDSSDLVDHPCYTIYLFSFSALTDILHATSKIV